MITRDERIAFLERHGAGSAGHANERTLLEHVIATERVLRAWGACGYVADAALYHSVYGTEFFRTATVSRAVGRERVRALIGADAERLVYLFCTLRRADLRRNIEARGSESDLEIERLTSDGCERVTPRELFGLVLLHAANDFEQCCASDGSPAQSLSRLRTNLALLAPALGALPWPATGPLATLTPPDERRLLARYRAAVDSLARGPADANAFRSAAERCSFLSEPFFWSAYVALRKGDSQSALAMLDRAEANLRRLGAPWDKRLTYDEWQAAIDALRRHAGAGARDEPLFEPGLTGTQTFDNLRAALPASPAGPATGHAGARSDRQRFYRFIDGYVDPATPHATTYFPGLVAKPWHEAASFPITRALEAAHLRIARELARIDPQAFQAESEPIERAGMWEVFMLYERGRRHDENCALLPAAMEVLERFETVRTVIGLAYLSRLLPGTHIQPHRGPTNLRVRCHLPLLVPKGDCALRVGTRTRRWETGRCLVFDDSFTHEAWNHTAEPRVVLVIDLWHPGLSPEEIRLIAGLQDRMLLQTENLMQYWADNRRVRTQSARSQT